MTGVYNALEGQRRCGWLPRKSRYKCACCGRRATHYGAVDGCTMMIGCEMQARRWVKSPYAAHFATRKR